MASLNHKDGSPFWWAWYHDAKGKLHGKSTGIPRLTADPVISKKNQQAAQFIADTFERQAKAGQAVGLPKTVEPPSIPGIPSFQEYSRGWISAVKGDASYRAKLITYFDNADEFLGEKRTAQICHLHRVDFIGFGPFLENEGYSGNTITSHLKAVNQCYLAAIKDGFALMSPILPEDLINNYARYAPAALSVGAIECLINSTLVIDWRTAFLLGFYGGIRRSGHRCFQEFFASNTASQKNLRHGPTLEKPSWSSLRR